MFKSKESVTGDFLIVRDEESGDIVKIVGQLTQDEKETVLVDEKIGCVFTGSLIDSKYVSTIEECVLSFETEENVEVVKAKKEVADYQIFLYDGDTNHKITQGHLAVVYNEHEREGLVFDIINGRIVDENDTFVIYVNAKNSDGTVLESFNMVTADYSFNNSNSRVDYCLIDSVANYGKSFILDVLQDKLEEG